MHGVNFEEHMTALFIHQGLMKIMVSLEKSLKLNEICKEDKVKNDRN